MDHASQPRVQTDWSLQKTVHFCLLVWLVCAATSSAEPAASALSRFEFNEPEMGVPFRIVLYAETQAIAESTAKAAFARVAQLNQIMSDYETDSELNELSRTSGEGKAVHVSDDLWKVLERAQQISKLSDGAFDITVGPVVSLWRKARRTHQMPDPVRLAEARNAVGWEKIRLMPEDHKVELLQPGMKLDLGGIGKGYGLNAALQILRDRGITRALVTGGGDMAIGDPPPGQPGWRIEIAPLDVPDAPPKAFVQLTNRGLATSGDLFQRLEIDGRRYSHIVDPHTGIGLTDHSLVTIIASDATLADALSKVVSVLGPDRGLKIIEQVPSAVGHVVRKPGERIETVESSGFRAFYAKP
jgi:thiamine biosynthesis lipoprotein